MSLLTLAPNQRNISLNRFRDDRGVRQVSTTTSEILPNWWSVQAAPPAGKYLNSKAGRGNQEMICIVGGVTTIIRSGGDKS